MKLGYARVSTDDQSLSVQVGQLLTAGCVEIFRDKRSGKTADRASLQSLLHFLETQVHVKDEKPVSPVVVVTKLDRLARNTRDLLEILDRIGRAGASFVSLAEPWANTDSPAGKMVLTFLAGVAQFERERMIERQKEGIARAKREGKRLGRRPALSGLQRKDALERLERGESPVMIAALHKVHKNTIYRLKG